MRRPTSGVVAIILAAAIGVAIVAIIVGLVVLHLDDPDTDLMAEAAALGSLLTGLLGFLAGLLLRGGGNDSD